MEKQFECTKIKDGLYLGNKVVAFDLQFLLINKFAYVVNCASEVPNLFEQHGIKYLKFKIKHQKNQHIFDQELKRLKKMKKIIAEAEDSGLCCLIHCNQSKNRSLVMLIAYLMDRFRWTLRKTLEFLNSKGVTIMLTEPNIDELSKLEYTLSKEYRLSHLWASPFLDDQQQLLSRTFNNTAKQNNSKGGKPSSPKNRQMFSEGEETKPLKKVQWLDRIQKQEKKEKKRLLAERAREEKMERSKDKFEEDRLVKKDSKAHNMIIPKEGNKRSKKKLNEESDTDIKRNLEEAEILKLLKKTGKLKKRLEAEEEKQEGKQEEKQEGKQEGKQRGSLGQEQICPKDEEKMEEKKVYKLTINNYINPNINIIKPPLDKKKKGKTGLKKEKDKFSRTYSQKQAFKKACFFEKDLSKGKETSTEKRHSNHTPLRSRKERKSEKQKL